MTLPAQQNLPDPASLPRSLDPQLRRFLQSVAENIRVGAGVSGSRVAGGFMPDKVVRQRDLLSLKLAKQGSRGALSTVLGAASGGALGGNGATSGYTTGATDPRPPSALTGLTAATLAGGIMLSVNAPTEVRVSYIEWFRSATNDRSTATKIGQSAYGTPVYLDQTGPGQTYFYWVRAVSKMNVTGPFNALAGVQGTSGLSSSYVLSQLNTQVQQASNPFIIRADNFAVATKTTPGTAAQYPFIIGTVNGTSTVGINGALVVDGTINARSIVAKTIGAGKLNVATLDAISADMGTLTAGTIQTAASPAVRAEISSAGSFPLWIGSGTKSSTNALFSVDTNGAAILRGVTVYDSNGNTLLSSGSGIPESGITGLGAFATLDQINSSNISTYIANAAMGSAQIGNASVGTLAIAGQAVTFPQWAYTAGTLGISATTWTTVQTLTISVPNYGQSTTPVEIIGSARFNGSAINKNTGTFQCRLIVGGAVQGGTQGVPYLASYSYDSTLQTNLNTIYWDALANSVVALNLAPGDHTVQFQVYGSYSGNSSNRYIRGLVLKR